MTTFLREHLPWVIFSLAVIAIVLVATVYSFWNKRFMDSGPRKGEAADLERIRRDNPPDRH